MGQATDEKAPDKTGLCVQLIITFVVCQWCMILQSGVTLKENGAVASEAKRVCEAERKRKNVKLEPKDRHQSRYRQS